MTNILQTLYTYVRIFLSLAIQGVQDLASEDQTNLCQRKQTQRLLLSIQSSFLPCSVLALISIFYADLTRQIVIISFQDGEQWVSFLQNSNIESTQLFHKKVIKSVSVNNEQWLLETQTEISRECFFFFLNKQFKNKEKK